MSSPENRNFVHRLPPRAIADGVSTSPMALQQSYCLHVHNILVAWQRHLSNFRVLFTWKDNPVGGKNLAAGGRNLVVGNQVVGTHHPGDSLEQVEGMHRPGGNLEQEGMHHPEGNQLADNLDQEQVDSHHEAAHRLVVVRIRPVVVRTRQEADRCVTFVAPEALPWAADQTSHPSCPFQFCAVSAYRRKPSSRPNQTGS